MSGPVEQPIDGILDLHTFHPGEVKELVPDYLAECRMRGVLRVRIIHGKGTGTLKSSVRSVLKELSWVSSFEDAEAEGGGWGATIVVLRSKEE